MQTIEIDFDVYKALTLRRNSETVSYNDVLRDLLKLGTPRADAMPSGPNTSGRGRIGKGVFFPESTQLRAQYKGQQHQASVVDGAINCNGERYTSPSPAAMAITGTQVNGWKFWDCRLPGEAQWQTLDSVWRRKQR